MTLDMSSQVKKTLYMSQISWKESPRQRGNK